MKFSRLAIATVLAFALLSARADQNALQVPTSGPHSMADLNTNYVNPALKSLAGCNWGTSAPANFLGAPTTGECWINTATSPWQYEIYDGASWDVIYTINATSHAAGVPSSSLTGSALPSTVTSAPGLQSFGAAINFNQFVGNTTSAASVTAGGSLAGSNGTFVTYITATAVSSFTLTFPTAATTGWLCPVANDLTTTSASNFLIKQTGALSTTTATLSVFSDTATAGTVTSGDKIEALCFAL